MAEQWTIGNETEWGVFNACFVYIAGTQSSVAQVYGIPAHTKLADVEADERYAEGLGRARLIAAAPDLLEALIAVNALVAEGAATGFNPNSGTWAERLFLSNQATSNALIKAMGGKEWQAALDAFNAKATNEKGGGT